MLVLAVGALLVPLQPAPLATLATDRCHVRSVLANHAAALAACLSRFFRRKLVRAVQPVRGASARARNFSLTLAGHQGKASPGASCPLAALGLDCLLSPAGIVAGGIDYAYALIDSSIAPRSAHTLLPFAPGYAFQGRARRRQ